MGHILNTKVRITLVINTTVIFTLVKSVGLIYEVNSETECNVVEDYEPNELIVYSTYP